VNPRIMRPKEVSRILRLNAAERASISQARLLLRFEGQELGVIRERSQDSTGRNDHKLPDAPLGRKAGGSANSSRQQAGEVA
jgi:hypothetical protein